MILSEYCELLNNNYPKNSQCIVELLLFTYCRRQTEIFQDDMTLTVDLQVQVTEGNLSKWIHYQQTAITIITGRWEFQCERRIRQFFETNKVHST